jgi:hypothetical protein
MVRCRVADGLRLLKLNTNDDACTGSDIFSYRHKDTFSHVSCPLITQSEEVQIAS